MYTGVFLKKVMQNNKSSSKHSLSADKRLSKLDKIKWFTFNIVNNLDSTKTDSVLEYLYFNHPNINEYKQELNKFSSPSRLLSDQFWSNIDWSNLSNSLNCKINAIETGCGTGKYGQILDQYLGKTLKHYVGVDVKPRSNWDTLSINPKFNFVEGNSNSISKHLKGQKFDYYPISP